MAQFDATEVFALMKRRGFVPSAASGFTESEFIAAVGEEIESEILPKLVKANSKHLLRTEDQSITAGVSQYRVPDRCANNGIYSVWLVNAANGTDKLEEIDPGDIPKMGVSLIAGIPKYYTFEGPFLTLYPPPAGSTGTLRVKYQIRPSRLVPLTSVGVIASSTTSTITLASSPGANLGSAGPFDIVRAKGSFEHLGIDLAGSRSGTAVTAIATPTGVNAPVANDYFCNVYETPIPQLPHGLHLPAAMRGVASIIAAKGMRDQAKWLVEEAAAKEKNVLESLLPRNQTHQQDFVNPWWG